MIGVTCDREHGSESTSGRQLCCASFLFYFAVRVEPAEMLRLFVRVDNGREKKSKSVSTGSQETAVTGILHQ